MAFKRVAEYPNIYCKLSGLVTKADHASWTPASFSPYVDHVLNVFGPDRLMFGSDWPVCRLAAEYAEVINALRTILDTQPGPRETEKLFYSNTVRFYGHHS